MEFTAKQIAAFLNGTVEGDENATVNTFAKIEEGVPGALSFLANPKYVSHIYDTRSSVVLVNRDFVAERAIDATLVRVDNAYEGVAKLLALYESMKPVKTGISTLAYVAPTAQIGKDVYVAPFAVVGDRAVIADGVQLHPHATVGDGVEIGEGTILYSHAVVYHGCKIGKHCVLHAGCVIGADGFGFAPNDEGYEKIPQIGIVVLEDKVEVGANTCIDRATMGATVIHQGTKLDNLIQIGHNVEVGSHTVMAAQTGVAGSTKIGKWCRVGGQVGFAGHIQVGDNVTIGAQSGISGNVKSGMTMMGYPAMDAKKFARNHILFRNFQQMAAQVDNLKHEIEELKKSIKS